MQRNLLLKTSAFVIGMVLVLPALFGMIQKTQKAKPAPAVVWTTNLEKAMKQAKKEKKILLVDFNASWCGPCQMYKKDVFPTAKFKAATRGLILVDIDTDKHPEYMEKYKVDGIPDIRLMSADGKELSQVVGFGGVDPLIEAINKAKALVKKK